MRLAREACCMHSRVQAPSAGVEYSQRHGLIWKDLEGAVAFSNVLQRDVSPVFRFRRYGPYRIGGDRLVLVSVRTHHQSLFRIIL